MKGKYSGTVRLIKQNGNIRYNKSYFTKADRREIITKWLRMKRCFVHVLPDLTGVDSPVEDEVQIKVPKRSNPAGKKKTDPEIKPKYVNKIYHIPKGLQFS